jgi:uncharacterized hydrophobic protein (TIGR00271 family)
MLNRYFFLYHHEVPKETAEALAAKINEAFRCAVTLHIFKKQKAGFHAGDTVFVMADDAGFAAWLRHNASSGMKVIIVPFEKNRTACQAYGIPAKPDDALALAADASAPETHHMTLCNDRLVLERVLIGRTDWHTGGSVMSYVNAFFKSLLSLTLQPVHIETAKAQQTDTAALLIDAGNERTMTRRHPHYFRTHEDQCSRIAMLIYAPQSLLSLLRLQLPLIGKNGTEENAALPDGAGTLKSETIALRSPAGKLRVACDGTAFDADTVTLQSVETPTAVVSGLNGCVPRDDKESLRVQNLPKDEETITHISSKTLPLIPVASESAFTELFTVLRQEAAAERWYLVLLLLSTLMAATGLFQNSSPTVIGAMILSPLMAPVIVLAMGLIRFDKRLLTASLKTLLLSVAMALAASALFAYAIPLTHMTAQMSARMNPNLLDLAVAFFAGIAAAYGYAHARVAKSLAGVAVAVALVPPLSVAGIGLGWASWPMFYGAFLLFLANIAGIIAAAGVTFFLMGFSSWRYAKTAFILKLLMLSAVAIPLYLSTRSLLDMQAFYSRFDKTEVLHAGTVKAALTLENVTVENGTVTAGIIITVPHDVSEAQKQQLIRILKDKLGTDARLNIMFQYFYE